MNTQDSNRKRETVQIPQMEDRQVRQRVAKDLANSRLQTPAVTLTHPTPTHHTPAVPLNHPTPTVTPEASTTEVEHPDVARRITGQTGLLEGVTKCNHFASILEAIDLT